MKLDIISIGSCTVDVFVETKEKHFIREKDHFDIGYAVGSKLLIKNLFFSTGGGGTNTAVSFSRLGLKIGWLGVLGNDHNSDLVIDVLKKEKVNILSDRKKGNIGYSIILSKLRNDRTILTYKGINDDLTDVPKLNADWFYISSMLGKSFQTTKKIVKKIKREKKHWAFNPSTYLAKQGLNKLMLFIKDCDLLVLNKEEAQLLIGTKKELKQLLKQLQKYAKIVVITDGKKGATAYNGINFYSSKPNNVKIIETTGAGDAFASGMLSGILKGENLQTALQIGQLQAEGVIQYLGAKEKLLTWKEIKRKL
ncbi:carbohydrate kinase family protein [archaeon]|nr:carbohydrate kinase family protein [archaeon]